MQGGKKMRASKMFKKITSFALVAAIVAPMAVSTPANVDAAKKMKLSKSSFLLATGQKKTVSVKNASKKAKFTWKTSSKKVVAIKAKKAKATLTAKGAGTARISCVVKVGKKKTTVSGLTVKVRQTVKTATMDSKIDNLKINGQATLKVAINNNASGSTTNQTIKWSTSNAKVAIVKKSNVNSAKVTGKGEGTATITAIVAPNSKTDKKVLTCTVKVAGVEKATPTPTAKTSPTPTPFPKGIIYKQRNDVTRWYEPATAATSENGHAHDGYKNNNFAIWMVGFFDNKYSSNEDEWNTTYGPDLTNVFNAQYTGTKDANGKEKGHDYRGEKLNIKGEFSYDGTAQKTILLQINYTKPDDYPIMHKWEKGASTWKGEGPQKNLGLTGNCGSEALDPGKTGKVDVTFTIPESAVNGDKDDKTGENFGIYIYFPNRPGGALAYRKDNTFHFKNFIISEAK